MAKYWQQAEERQSIVTTMFDRAAAHYDVACNIMSFGTGGEYRRAALSRAGVGAGMRVLDVGTGTGLVAREALHLVGPAGSVIGVDPSFNMLNAGRRGGIGLVQGVGERLPFPDDRFDFVTMGYALRHVPDLDVTFREYRRVLRPGGRVLLLEITKPTSRLASIVAPAYFGVVVPSLAGIATRSGDVARLMRFYWDTIRNCVSPDVVLGSLRRGGFSPSRTVVSNIFSEYTATKS